MNLKFFLLIIFAFHSTCTSVTPDDLLTRFEQILLCNSEIDSLSIPNILTTIQAEVQLLVGDQDHAAFHFTPEQEARLVEQLGDIVAETIAIQALETSPSPTQPPSSMPPLHPDPATFIRQAATLPSQDSILTPPPHHLLAYKIEQFCNQFFITKFQRHHFMTALKYMQNPALLSILEQEFMWTLANNFEALATQNYTQQWLGLDPHANLLASISFYETRYLCEHSGALSCLRSIIERCTKTQLQYLESYFYFTLQQFFRSGTFWLPGILLPYPQPEAKTPQFIPEMCPLHIAHLQRWPTTTLMQLLSALSPFLKADLIAQITALIISNDKGVIPLILEAFQQSSNTCRQSAAKNFVPSAKL
jgi:hypothetical protein